MRIHVIILYLQHLLFEKDKLKKIKRVGILFVLSQERETDILVCYKSHAESVEELRNKSDMSHFTPDQKITFFFFSMYILGGGGGCWGGGIYCLWKISGQ